MSTTTGFLGALYVSDNDSTYAAEVAGSNAFTELTQVTNISPPQRTATDIDTTHLKSAENYETFRAGRKNAGELTFTVQYTATQFATIIGLFGVDKGWKMLFADDTDTEIHDGGLGLDGYIKSIGKPFEADGLVLCEVTIKISGKPTVIAADTTPAA